MHRGTDSFDWFENSFPSNVPVVDGMEPDDVYDGEFGAEGERASSTKKSITGSSRGPPHSIVLDNDDNDNETAIDRLAAALRPVELPEKRQYYLARTKRIQLKNEQIVLQNEEEKETRDLRIMSRQAEESRKAIDSIVIGLNHVNAAMDLTNIGPSTQVELSTAESNLQKLLASLNNKMSVALNSQKRSREESDDKGDSDASDSMA